MTGLVVCLIVVVFLRGLLFSGLMISAVMIRGRGVYSNLGIQPFTFRVFAKVTCHFKTSGFFWMTSDARSLSNTEEIGQSPKTPYMIFLKVCFFVVKVSYL